MKSRLYIGSDPDIQIPKGGCLLIDSRVRDIPEWRHPRIFDPVHDSFNPLAELDYRKSCDVVDIFDALFTRGETTLTKDAGLDLIFDMLERRPATFAELADLIETPDKKSLPGHVWGYSKVRRILRSPVLSKVFCDRPNSTFKRGSVNQARINRAELGSFDALALALFLIAQYPGQIIVPNFRPYARPFHSSLIEEGRLIAGVHSLSQLAKELDEMRHLMECIPRQCRYRYAETLAEEAGLIPDRNREDNPYNRFIAEAMAA